MSGENRLLTPDKLDSLLASIDAIPEIGNIHFESGVRQVCCEQGSRARASPYRFAAAA
jgi:hypothetical protein